VNTALRKRAFDLLRSNQRARRVVHSNIFRVAIDPIQASPNGILSTFTAGNNRPDFFEPFVSTDTFDFIMPFFTPHDDDFAYGLRVLERADCVSDHWFARDCSKQLIEPHALAAATRYDDGAQHSAEKKRPTPNAQRPISKSERSHSALGVER